MGDVDAGKGLWRRGALLRRSEAFRDAAKLSATTAAACSGETDANQGANRMRILALDASTTSVGWCVAEDDEYIDSGVFRPGGDSWWIRLASFQYWLHGQFAPTGFGITSLFYEIATGNKGNMHTNRLLGAAEYIVREIAEFVECPLTTVTASQVRASGCHKDALSVASSIAGRPVESGDEADAIGCWLAGLAKLKQESL